jgi:CRP-like cAMP-binding protein
MQALIHVANVIYLFSYLVRDILWLRLLTIVAGLVLLAYFALLPEPLWPAIGWNVLFSVINAYQVYLLWLERRPVVFTDEEQRLYRLAFRTLTPREFKKLVGLGSWQDAAERFRLVEKGRELERMMVICSGSVHVEVGDKRLAELREGQLVGEMSFLTGEFPNADVVAAEPTRLVSWPKANLREFLDKNPELRSALQMVIGKDLAGKLRAV